MEDATVQQMFQKLTKLQEVDLSQFEQLSDLSLYHLALNCPDLAHLNVAFCWRITDMGLKLVMLFSLLVVFKS